MAGAPAHVLPLFSMSAVSASLCVTMMICYSLSAPLHAFATTGIVGVLGAAAMCGRPCSLTCCLWLFTLPLLVLLGLILHAPIALFCFVMAMESALKVPFGLHRIHSGKWIHDVTKGWAMTSLFLLARLRGCRWSPGGAGVPLPRRPQ